MSYKVKTYDKLFPKCQNIVDRLRDEGSLSFYFGAEDYDYWLRFFQSLVKSAQVRSGEWPDDVAKLLQSTHVSGKKKIHRITLSVVDTFSLAIERALDNEEDIWEKFKDFAEEDGT